MRSALPIFILVGVAMIAVLGVVILGAASSAAIAEVNDTSTEELPLVVYESEYAFMFGIAAVLLLVAGYFALRNLI